MPGTSTRSSTSASVSDALGVSLDSPLPLSFLAYLLEFETDKGSFRENVLAQMDEEHPIRTQAEELDALQRRFCHPRLPGLAEEVATMERQLREVLEAPGDIPYLLRKGEVYREEYSHLGSWTLCIRVCESCIDIAARDSERGLEVARAAVAIAEDLSSRYYQEHHRQQIQALAWAHVANAYRIPGNLRQARRCFAEVQARQQWQSPDMAGLWAEIQWIQGTVLRDSRDLLGARRHLEGAIALAIQSHRSDVQAGATLNLASLDYEEGAADQAVERTRQALALLDPQQQPSWYADACINVANYLCRAGDGAAALEHLARHLPELRQHCSPGDLARLPWIEGVALRALGRLEEAAVKYDEARRSFLDLGRGYDAALSTLELAIVHLEQGHTAEVKRLAAEILPVFEMQGIDREARATLELFRQAALAEQVTLLQLRGWLARLGVRT